MKRNMQQFRIRLAGRNIEINALYPYIREYSTGYLTDEPADFALTVTPSDIDYERMKSAREDEAGGIPVRHFSNEYLETLAVYRKIADRLLEDNVLLFHGSVIAVDGIAYLFTAKSGTGKSTHTRLWREHFGDRAVMVNDDKPLLRIDSSGVTAYGTPWDGKHRLSSNVAVPLKAICILNRDIENHIEMIDRRAAWPMLLQQSYRPADAMKMTKVMTLIDELAAKTELYALGCNMEPTAALVAYEGMNQRKD